MKLWKNNLSEFSKHFICNSCGIEVQDSKTWYCIQNRPRLHNAIFSCGAVIKYIRIGGMSQLVDLGAQYIEKIKEVRRNLKTRSDTTHNLNSSHFKKLWKNEKGNMMIMTLLASIDGVSLSGNTNLNLNKLWPLTFSLVDLPTAEMQRATNMVLHGIAKATENPSTTFWNKIVPMVYTDVEGSRHAIGNATIQFMIGTWIADQPAKRSLFGFKACNGESSCFYGLCSGTHHKKQGPNRETERPDELTILDATNGTNGFGTIPPRIVDFVLPYDAVLDLLHNAAEGIFSIVIRGKLKYITEIERVILSESLASESSQPRSDLFQNDRSVYLKFCDEVIVPSQFEVKNITNCSEKLLFFRFNFGLAALSNDSLKPEARIKICSLMLILNILYTKAPSSSNRFFAHLTGAARWALEQASPTYMGTKTHEFLCHLPYVIGKFGNIAPLSTFCFEHF
ncbi:hypothetical protein CRE_25894 [Caenorhabditis remanei]|uniref:Uncharacterized protein n=1 Tax=Caenorhabditis remanei TaxID=31234 RepID=E3NGF9_CAERE|nr:hypothetical protein CRE_25894 [Caenorhabditis remanei]